MHDDELERLLAPLPSGRHGLPREQVVRSQRLRILTAMIAVAGADGYAATTVTSVLARASVSRKTFYEQFADREHCFLAAAEAVLDRALDGLRAAYAPAGPWPERLRRTLAWGLDALAAHEAEARVVLVELPAAGPRALALRDRALHELTPLFAPGFDAAPAGVAVPPSMPVAVVGAVGELLGARIRHGGVAELPALLPDLLYCALAPFTGPIAAAEASAPDRPRRVRRGRAAARH
ncbi:MAG TPA: TetR/AcrR family transcriptional regulator [Conexibacter sp.]|nr:TetR/AcrR family transcriptional regulator [Conexibacter sp.]